jgi:hypothetical protein
LRNSHRDYHLAPMAAALSLACLPIVSFMAQWLLSRAAGTETFFVRHLTVMVVDWVFVPFNYNVAKIIDWRRGGRLYLIVCCSVILNVVTHAFWQYNGLDLGHMITRTGIVLPAGWAHLSFSIMEMTLLVAFIFCRKATVQEGAATFWAAAYFVSMGICAYAMHRALIISDVAVFVSGLFFVLAYPRLRRPISWSRVKK